MRGEQYQAIGLVYLIKIKELLPRGVANDLGQFMVIHCHPTHAFVIERKAARLDDMQRNAHARAQPYHASSILRDIRLKQGDKHSVYYQRVSD